MQTNNNATNSKGIELVDIGANLTNASYQSNLADVIQRAKNNAVENIIVTGTSPQQSIEATELCFQYPGFLFSTAGCHPHHAKDFINSDLNLLRELSQKKQVVAIGECGLDFNRNFSPQDVQIKVFKQQLELACELGMPVFLHQRDAHKKFIEILEQYRQGLKRAVVHCFTEGIAELNDYLALDCYIGVTGWVCDEKRGRQLQQAVTVIPKDKIMLETDAPYLLPKTLTPKPKSNRNEPMNLFHICEKVAQLRKESVINLSKLATLNSRIFFEI